MKRQLKLKPNNTYYNVNPDHFLDIKTPEVAYILGLLWADGHVGKNNTISISILKKDMDKVLKVFMKIGRWGQYEAQQENRQKQLMLYTCNDKLTNFLLENDYKSKSYESADKILSKIPEYLKYYWFRGLVDGDGCIRVDKKHRTRQIFIASGYEQNWNYMELQCNRLNIKYKIVKRMQFQNGRLNKNSIFLIRQSESVKIFGNYIYNNYLIDGIGLSRKYKKFTKILEIIKEFKQKTLFPYIGVIRMRGKFHGRVKKNKKLFTSKPMDTIEEAAKAYDELAIKLHGQGCKLNFPSR